MDDSRKSIALFNKDWNTYKTNWRNAGKSYSFNNGGNQAPTTIHQNTGVGKKISSIFNSNDVNALSEYNRLLREGISPAKAYEATMIGCTKEARQNAVAMAKGTMSYEQAASGLKSMTISAKAASIGLKALSIAGNMLMFMAVVKGIQLVTTTINDITHASEKCKERVDELMSSYKSSLDMANSNANKTEELAAKYESLSKGVNKLGEKTSLTTDEYAEYNKIVNDIAGMFPTLISGYTNEGNAILSLKGNVEELRDAYKEAQQEAYNMLIVSGEDSDGNDIIKFQVCIH